MASRRRRVASDTDDCEAVFDNFKDEIFSPFAEEMAENIKASLELDPVCGAFACLDVKNFPKSEAELDNFGKEDLEVLIKWYGVVKHREYPGDPGQISSADPVINPYETRVEYKKYKSLLASEHKKFIKDNAKAIECCEKKLVSIKRNKHSNRDKRKVEELEKELKWLNENDFKLNDIYSIVNDPMNVHVMPNVRILVLLAALSPVGNAVVERLFSLMKITKTVLRNRVGDAMLDMLLRLKVEAPEAWTEDEKDELVELWIARRKRKGIEFRWKL